jgi:hypothetical protein
VVPNCVKSLLRIRRGKSRYLSTYDDVDVVLMADRSVLEAEGSIRVGGVRCTEGVQPNERRTAITDPVARESPRWAPYGLINTGRASKQEERYLHK